MFRYLADPRNRPEWQSSLLSVTLLDRGEPRVGMSWRDNTMVGMRPTMEITELQPFRLWAEEGGWRGVRATLTLRFTAIAPGCRVDALGSLSGERRLGGAGACGRQGGGAGDPSRPGPRRRDPHAGPDAPVTWTTNSVVDGA